MRLFLAVAATTLLFVMAQAPTLEAQDRPDFSGSWTLAETEGGAAAGAAGQRGQQGQAGQRGQMGQRQGQGQMGQRGGMGMLAGLGQQATLTHDAAANTLTLVRAMPQGEIRQVFNLDGSESRNRLSMGNNQIDQVSRASWDGAALMIVSQLPMGGQNIETRMKLSIDDDGKLVVETTRSGGPGGQGGGTVRSTYTKG
jgi:hypothetical protein